MKTITGQSFVTGLFIILFGLTSVFAKTVHYTYDDLNRLVQVEYDNGAVIGYAYDDVGNRLTKTVFLPDADNDGVPDSLDSDPNDPENTGEVVNLPVNMTGTEQYGWKWGTDEHFSVLAAVFDSDGEDCFLHVQSYDIDSPLHDDEVGVYLNGTFLGYLNGSDENTGPDSLWHLPADLQQTGENRIEFRQKQKGFKWGITRLGVFDTGSAFGNLKTLANGDTDHPDGFEFHFRGGDSRLLELVGFDSDPGFPDEIQISLNGNIIGGLPEGTDEEWTGPYHLYLPQNNLNTGDNVLTISNKYDAAFNWGIRIDAVRNGNDGLGRETGHTDKVNYLVFAGSDGGLLSFEIYDSDFADEVKITVSGMAQGFADGICNDSWCLTQTVIIAPGQLVPVKFDNTYNPPNTYLWAVRITGLTEASSTDTDGDGLPDDFENVTCTDSGNPDTDADGIPDGIEDANRNGIGDAGETDPCDADSDGDTLSDGQEDTNKNGVVDESETDPLNPDTDEDGIADNLDSDPNDPENTGSVISLPVNMIGSEQYGWNWGSNEHYSVLTAVFQSDGEDRFMHVQSYDIDSHLHDDEVGVYLNGTFLGYLNGSDGTLGPDSLWHLPADLQQTGENRIEFRQKQKDFKWGITRLGIFDTGSTFGNLKSLADGDTEHGNGFEFHFIGGEAKLLEHAGFDSSDPGYPDEIRFTLNDVVIGGIPQGPNEGWTSVYHLYLPDTMLNNGDNILMIDNRYNTTFNWGIMLNGISAGSTPLGKGVPGTATDYIDKITYLIPGGTTEGALELGFYDADFADEIQVSVNGAVSGFAFVTPDNGWGAAESFVLPAGQLAVAEIDCTYNPPNTNVWGTRILSVQ